VPNKVTNQHRREPVNVQDDNMKPQMIPTIVNGSVSTSKDKEVFCFHNNVNELYAKLRNRKSSQNPLNIKC
jgi:hypothetical protein